MSNDVPKRGDIYWSDLRPGKGSEQNGFRPVLIISNNLMNVTSTVVLAVPMSTSDEKAKAGPFNISYKKSDYSVIASNIADLKRDGHSFVHEDGVLLCNQSRAISKSRLKLKVGEVTNRQVMHGIKEALIHSFGLDACERCAYPVRPNAIKCSNCNSIHRRKCKNCKKSFDLLYNYCPHCGEGV